MYSNWHHSFGNQEGLPAQPSVLREEEHHIHQSTSKVDGVYRCASLVAPLAELVVPSWWPMLLVPVLYIYLSVCYMDRYAPVHVATTRLYSTLASDTTVLLLVACLALLNGECIMTCPSVQGGSATNRLLASPVHWRQDMIHTPYSRARAATSSSTVVHWLGCCTYLVV